MEFGETTFDFGVVDEGPVPERIDKGIARSVRPRLLAPLAVHAEPLGMRRQEDVCRERPKSSEAALEVGTDPRVRLRFDE